MDSPFPPSAWQPTRPPEADDCELTESDLTALINRLNSQTKHIADHPYDPHTWVRRAETLAELRYPELAVGDAYKAGLLAGKHLATIADSKTQDAGETTKRDEWKWHLGHRMGFFMLHPRTDEDEERLEMLTTYLTHLRAKAERVKTDNLAHWPTHEEGHLLRRQYPWMPDEFAVRSDALIEEINEHFKGNAYSVLPIPVGSMTPQTTACIVRRHAFGPSTTPGKDTSNVLGVFAARDLHAEQTILIDRTRIWGCNGPGTDGSLANLHGGKGCLDPLHPNDEDDEAEHCLRWIRDEAGRDAAGVLLGVRMLMECVLYGRDRGVAHHPLSHPLVARLTPTYSAQHAETFTLRDDIAIPLRALTKLGIDIFANPQYDTWVLFTISVRMANNSSADPITETLAPLFSLFNHSCEPNCSWNTGRDHRTIIVRAEKEVKEGEQLFVEYDGFVSERSVEVRRTRLWRWLEGPCMCTRCVREEKEGKMKEGGGEAGVQDGRVDEKMTKDGEGGDNGKGCGNGWNVPKEELPVL